MRLKFSDKDRGFNPYRSTDSENLDNIKASLSELVLTNERLRFAEPGCDFTLGQSVLTSRFPH